jgi:hypothetical protein
MLQLVYSLEDGLQCHANPQFVELNPNLQPKLLGTSGWITGDTTGGNHTWWMLYCMCILCRFYLQTILVEENQGIRGPQMMVDLSSECCPSFGTVHKDSSGPTIQVALCVLFYCDVFDMPWDDVWWNSHKQDHTTKTSPMISFFVNLCKMNQKQAASVAPQCFQSMRGDAPALTSAGLHVLILFRFLQD